MFERVKKVASKQDLIKEIGLRVASLEKFPRMNKHCVDWFDKYNGKHEALKNKFDEQQETETGIMRLLADLEVQKLQALERNFKNLAQNFSEIF